MRFRMPFGRHFRLSLCAALLLSWSGALPALAAQQQASTASDAEADKAHQVLQNLVELTRRQLNQPGTDPTDVAYRAAALGHEVHAIFAFARDQVTYEPYRGLLRGAAGTLAAGAGNALDQSLLLKQLLERSGYQARLVRGQLPREKAAELIDQFLARDPASGLLGRFVPGDAPQDNPKLFEQTGFEPGYVRHLVTEQRRQTTQLLDRATQVTQRHAEFLEGHLGQAGVELGRSHEQWLEELAGRAADHAWVEYLDTADGAQNWIALDPSFASAQPGQPFAQGEPQEQVPPEEQHVVRLTLNYQRDKGGEPEDVLLLDLSIPADKALWEPPLFAIVPADELPPASKLLEMTPEESLKQILNIKNYQAIVFLGSQNHASRVFDLKGGVHDVSSDGRVKSAQQIGQAMGGLFGGLGGGSSEEPAGGSFLSLSMRITFESPGQAPHVQQRTLLTKQDVSGKFILSPILSWQMLIQPQLLSTEAADYGWASQTTRVLSGVLPLLEGDVGDAALNGISRQRPSTFPDVPVSLTLLRQMALAERVRTDGGVTVVWDRPQLIIAEKRFCGSLDGSTACERFGIDIVDNAMSVIPRKPGADAAKVALRQGVFDTVIEAMLPGTAEASGQARSAIASSERARIQGGSVTVLEPAQVAPQAPAALPESDRQWIASFEPESHRILIPTAGTEQAAAAGGMWWSLDPQTGTILGRQDGGRGNTTVEYVVQMVVGMICMGVVMYIQNRDIQKQGGGKLKGAPAKQSAIAMAGCLVGMAFGAGGVAVGAKVVSPALKLGLAQGLTVLNALIAAALSVWGYEAGS